MENTFVAKHRRQETHTAVRTVAAATAAVAGATMMIPAAEAAEVRVPNTPISAEVPGIENVPGIASIPGIEQWIPSLAGQATGGDVQPAIAAARNLPGVANVPSFNAFLDRAQAEAAPAAAASVQQYAAPAAAPQVSKGQQIVDIARSKIGSPYVYGAAGPDAFDCSGFTSWVYAQAGISIPRTSQAQAAAGRPVSLDDLQPGDIVAYYSGASHVAIYAGNGVIIDALNSGIPVGERPLHMMPVYSAFRFY